MKTWVTTLALLAFLCSSCFDVLAQDREDSHFVSFTTINRFANSTTDFDEVDDARNFTSEALFSQSQLRLNRPLTQDELARIIRTKEQFETFNNLRFRSSSSSAIDLSYKHRKIDDAQITNFFEPSQFNDVQVDEYGIAVQRSFDVRPYGFLVRGSYKRVDRKGIIEFLPESKEDINQYEVNALAFRPFGKDRAVLYGTYVFQDIRLDIPNPFDRKRDILAAYLTYGAQETLVRFEKDVRPVLAIENIFERRFDTRGLKFFGGVVLDKESFGDVDVKKNDYFIGGSLCAWMGATNCPIAPFDITIEPTVFTSEAEGDSTQKNAQYRTNIIVYYQVSKPLLLLVPIRHDVAIKGLDDFENWKAGVELRYQTDTRFSASLRYDHQRFYNVDKDLDLFGVNISLVLQ